jgi:curved DNA-binding protein CbpA
MTIPECFRILELPSNACLEDLKVAYREKAKQYHPDRKGGDSRKFTLLHDAYTYLLDYGRLHTIPVVRSTAPRDFREEFRKAAEEKIKREASLRAAREKERKEAAEKLERQRKRKEMEKKASERKAAYEKARLNEEVKAARERAYKLAARKNNASHKVCSTGEILGRTGSEKEKLAAIETLVSLKRKSAYPFLRKAFYDDSEKVVQASILAIGRLGIIQAGPELGSLFSSGSVHVKKTILEAISLIGRNHAYADIIKAAVDDHNGMIREKAGILYKRIYE